MINVASRTDGSIFKGESEPAGFVVHLQRQMLQVCLPEGKALVSLSPPFSWAEARGMEAECT